MHIRSHFQISSQQSYDLLGSHFFGQLITSSNGQLIQTFVPFIVDQQNDCLHGHIARQNQQFEALQVAEDLLVTFQGNDAYVSPSWYQSIEQVPTWNYQAVEIKGKATLLDNHGTYKVVDKLSQIHEAQFDEPWLIDKIPEKKIQAMLKAIVGFRIDIVKINGQSKMSQNKSVEDQQSVIEKLLSQNDVASHRVAEIMKKGGANE
jgi:transcriptional regulator